MNVERAISIRRSIRKFVDKPISDDVLRKILLAGNDAPSALNNQNKAFVAVVGENSKAMLNDIVKKNACKEVIDRVSARLNGEFHFFYHAPVLILVTFSIFKLIATISREPTVPIWLIMLIYIGSN